MANIMRTGGGLVEMGIMPEDYMLMSTDFMPFPGFDGKRIPLVEKKQVSVSVPASTSWVETDFYPQASWQGTTTSNYVTVETRCATYNNQNKAKGRAKFAGGTFKSTDQLIWLGTNWEELKQKTSGEIVVWLEPTN